MEEAAPRPTLRLGDAIGLIVGTVVGVGIFRTPSLVAANVDTPASALLAWLVGGIVSLLGALCYAELAAAYPHAGGDYHFLTRAYGGRLGFLFAWARLAVIQTGAIAILAFVHRDNAAARLPRGAEGPASNARHAHHAPGLCCASPSQGHGQAHAIPYRLRRARREDALIPCRP